MNLHFLKGLVMWYLHRPHRIRKYIRNNEKNEERIRRKEKITVVFFASNISMWRYQNLYEEMRKYPRYETYIVLSPMKSYTKEQNRLALDALKKMFDERHIPYHDFDTERNIGFDVKMIDPDILFYPQPYITVMTYERHRYYHFDNCLLAYYPYGFSLRRGSCYYDEDFHNRAWKRFYENEYTRQDCKEFSAVGDRNVEIVGHAVADVFMKSHKDVWKKQIQKKKRIIWAPHFTIFNDGWSQNTMFLEIADSMLHIADEEKERIQIAFKPHPRLKSELYKHPDWGKERTDKYYSKWEEMTNGQLEQGEYADLFMTSDAMIHDSGSFAAEYMFTGKPVMYTIKDMSVLYKEANGLGKEIYECHYIGKDGNDIRSFITDTVIKGDDKLKERRECIRNKYMLPPNGKTTAENTMDIINDCFKR